VLYGIAVVRALGVRRQSVRAAHNIQDVEEDREPKNELARTAAPSAE